MPTLALILLFINIIFAPHNPYEEKDSPFECGYHSFLGMNRTQFNIAFFLYGLCFLIFDLEILLGYPYAVSAYLNNIYGLFIVLYFFIILTIGLAYELGKGVLQINSRQNSNKDFDRKTYEKVSTTLKASSIINKKRMHDSFSISDSNLKLYNKRSGDVYIIEGKVYYHSSNLNKNTIINKKLLVDSFADISRLDLSNRKFIKFASNETNLALYNKLSGNI